MLGRISAQRLEAEFEAFRSGDASDTGDVLSRFAVVLSAAAALWYVTGSLLMPAWGLGYVLLNLLYFAFLRAKTGPTRPFHLAVTFASSAFIAAWYCAMARIPGTKS